MRLGNEVVDMVIGIMCELRYRPGYRAEVDTIPELAYTLRVEAEKLSSLIKDFDLFKIKDAAFYCPWLYDSMQPLDEKRRKLSEAGRKGGLKRKDDDPPPESLPKATIQPGLSDDEASPKPPESLPKASTVYNNNNNTVDNKQDSKKKSDSAILELFEIFWSLYDKKTDRKKAEKLWAILTDDERQKAIDHVPGYVKDTPDKQFRKDPATYLRNKSFENESIARIVDLGSSARNIDKSAGAREVAAGLKAKLAAQGTSEARTEKARNW